MKYFTQAVIPDFLPEMGKYFKGEAQKYCENNSTDHSFQQGMSKIIYHFNKLICIGNFVDHSFLHAVWYKKSKALWLHAHIMH